ncbi:MAG: hypothetical protein EXR24_03785 [Ignavibacteria bacterium]|nr:hypothetical protein [Bacteroidota bacterium]MSQ46085.1 hypothetical protein [Ignavibacteria bacterium]
MKRIIFLLLLSLNLKADDGFRLLKNSRIEDSNKKFYLLDNKFIEPKISSSKSTLASLIAPGLGEYIITSSSEKSIYPISAEVSLWLLYIGYNFYGSWKYDDAVLYSVQNAGVVSSGKDHNYFVVIGNYESIDDYNAEQTRNRNYEKIYNPETHYWKWKSSSERSKFRTTRVASDDAFDNTKFVVAGILLNHLVSALHTRYLLTTLQNQDLKLEVSSSNQNPQIKLNYSIILP